MNATALGCSKYTRLDLKRVSALKFFNADPFTLDMQTQYVVIL
nr:MAG TPA: hypothetical protein [Caudoviricetes sp.]